MRIDVIQIFQDNGIEYFESGKNVQTGWINIQCPLCDDQSNHGGFNLESHDTYFNCWLHGWSSLYSVFKKLIPHANFKELQHDYRNRNTDAIIEEGTVKEVFQKNKKVIIPGNNIPGLLHKRYFKKRDFNDLEYLIIKYNLHFTDHLESTDYKFRIIFPINWKGKTISYQGRDVTNEQVIRYKACSKHNELMNHKSILYNIDNCNKSYIGVVEGIFDCIRFGDNFAATFGVAYTNMQLQLLKKYKMVFIIFDPDKAGQTRAEKLSIALSSFGVHNSIIVLDDKNKDPAKLSDREVIQIKKELQIF